MASIGNLPGELLMLIFSEIETRREHASINSFLRVK